MGRGKVNPISEILGSAFTAALDAVMNRLFADYDAEDLEFAVEKKLSLLRIIEMGIMDYREEGDKWKPENKKRYKHFIAGLKFGRGVGGKVPMVMEKMVTTENVMGYIKRKKPDLYEVLATKEGQEWLSVSLPEIKLLLEKKIDINMDLVKE